MLRLALAGVAALMLAACAAGDLAGSGGSGKSLPEPDSVKASSNYSQTEYRIAASDVLDVNVYQFDKLSRVVQVDGNGTISLPLIGAVRAAGRTTPELEADIARRLGARYLQNPQVSVFVKESVGRQITVDGAVKKPGVYVLKGRTTLVQAVALGEGLNDVGDSSSVTLTRTVNGQRVSAVYDIGRIHAGGGDDPQVYGGDAIFVGESAARHGLQVLKSTVPAAVGVGTRAIP
ncbi:MAG: polysaccharide export protein [Hyphomicrobiales bacterium]|nr:polysaccharide export protein [Hyphomicrobiales bacterium]